MTDDAAAAALRSASAWLGRGWRGAIARGGAGRRALRVIAGTIANGSGRTIITPLLMTVSAATTARSRAIQTTIAHADLTEEASGRPRAPCRRSHGALPLA